ncbi:MAG: SurA N-terminal domain-containing protein [Nanoarchaeota archaeon]|nr:SurA N-terminal domain-containing protein [Nanoarchaeota archaeon]
MARRKKSKKDSSNYLISAIVIILIIAAVYMVMNNNPAPKKGAAAVVNGEAISQDELDSGYEKLPEQYKVLVTKEFYLEQLINTKLLLQEASSLGIVASEEEVDDEMAQLKNEFDDEEDFSTYLEENGMTSADVINQLKDKVIIDKLLEDKVYSQIEIPESRVKSFYDNNADQIDGDYEDVKGDIETMLRDDIASSAINTYINQLKAKATIVIGAEAAETDVTEEKPADIEPMPAADIGKFQETGDGLCANDGSPIIRMYSTTRCSVCNKISATFDSLAKEYPELDIAHWQLDTGDNTITEAMEEGITKEDLEIFKKYSKDSSVPALVFGCKYVKIGNVQELTKEKASYKAVIDLI